MRFGLARADSWRGEIVLGEDEVGRGEIEVGRGEDELGREELELCLEDDGLEGSLVVLGEWVGTDTRDNDLEEGKLYRII